MRAGPLVRRRYFLFFPLAVVTRLATPAPSYGQQATPVDAARAVNDQFAFFYKSPNPGAVPGLLQKWEEVVLPRQPLTLFYVIGFTAGLARKYPERISEMFPASLPAGGRHVAVAGVQAGRSFEEAAALGARNGWQVDGNERMHERFSLNVRLEDQAQIPFFLGASAATGDPTYLRRVLDVYQSAADQSDDMLAAILAVFRRARSSETKELRERLGGGKYLEASTAALALHTIDAEARRHEFAKRMVDEFLTAAKGSRGVQGLLQVRGQN